MCQAPGYRKMRKGIKKPVRAQRSYEAWDTTEPFELWDDRADESISFPTQIFIIAIKG